MLSAWHPRSNIKEFCQLSYIYTLNILSRANVIPQKSSQPYKYLFYDPMWPAIFAGIISFCRMYSLAVDGASIFIAHNRRTDQTMIIFRIDIDILCHMRDHRQSETLRIVYTINKCRKREEPTVAEQRSPLSAEQCRILCAV